MTMPFLTAALPGIGGQMRTLPEDFNVEERPLYLPCGEGEHLYVKIGKRLLSTPDLVLRLSSVLGVKAQAIGEAGVTPERLDRLKLDEQVLSVEVLGRHRNRLRPGHHAGNHFRLVIRDVATHARETVLLVTDVLVRRGVPNYFGPQRQGRSGQNYQTGAELLLDPARRNRLSRSKRMWYLNAYQSHFFNDMLARRLDRLDRILVGDWAMKMENGACFLVEDAVKEQPRADRFEISPTGILFGSRASWAGGEPGEIERAVVAESGATPEGLTEAAKACGFRGERRSFRIPLADLEWALEGTVLTLSFSLPPGAYATSVLRELMKTDSQAAENVR